MANTYELISSVTVGATSVANMEFTSIPATFTDLLLKISCRNDRSGSLNDAVTLQFNNDSSGSGKRIFGNGSAITNGASRYVIDNGPTSTANTFANIEFYIPNYRTSLNKTYSAEGVMENNATTAFATLVAGIWTSSAAITSIRIVEEVGSNFVQYSTAHLYGIKNS
jgi:hypothetical protein